MKVRRMVCLAVSVILLLVCMTAQAESAKFEAVIDGICERGGVLIEGILPGMSKEDVEAAGVVFGEEVRGAYTSDDGQVSEIYAVDSEKTPVFLSGVQMDEASFQFMDGKLINICLDTDNMEVLAAAYDSLFAQMGLSEDKSMGDEQNMTLLQQWTAGLESMTLRAGMTVAMRNGEPAFGSVQFSWLDDEMFGESLGVKAAKIEGLKERNFILIEGILPGMSKEEVEAAGLVLKRDPESEIEASDGVLASITYAVDTRKVSIMLDDVAIPSALAQFTQGKLSGITLNTSGAEGAQKIRKRLAAELGDVQKTQTMDNGRGSSTVDSWEIREEDLLTRIGMVFRFDENGKAIAANLQINWLPKELYPILFEEASE